MSFSGVFVDSLRYPFTDLKRFLVLILLFLGSFLILPALIAYGYMLRIIEYSIKGEDTLPDYDRAGDLIVPGIKLLIVSLIYGIPNLIITFLLLKKLSIGVVSPLILNSPITMIILFVVGFVVSLFFVLGLANMVYENRLMAAFDIKRIFNLMKILGPKKYVAYVLVYTIILNLISLLSLIIVVPALHPLTLGNILYFLVFYIVNGVISTFSKVFGSRFKGLIYPTED